MKNLKVPAFSSERFCKYKEQLPEKLIELYFIASSVNRGR
jgi:hypothetical protein